MKSMKVKSSELCDLCRCIPWGNGLTLEEMIDIIHNDERFKDKSDDEVNSAIFSTLYKYREMRHCTRCWKLLLDRLPSWMKGPR